VGVYSRAKRVRTGESYLIQVWNPLFPVSEMGKKRTDRSGCRGQRRIYIQGCCYNYARYNSDEDTLDVLRESRVSKKRLSGPNGTH
jgi:hypothetical protein